MFLTEEIHKTRMLVCFCLLFYFNDSVFGQLVDTTLKLKLVQVLFRHGMRTPFEPEAKLLNNFNESFYDPWGLTQLTNDGMVQEYEIGKMLRKRYNNFLPSLYKPEHVYAYASGTDRTKASLELVLAALYSPPKELEWNKNLNWIPIPIRSTPYSIDILMKPRHCPAYKEILREQLKSNDAVDAFLNHDPIIKQLKEKSGKSFDLNQLFQLYNALKIHKKLKLPLPIWYTDEIYQKIKEGSELYLDTASSTNDLKRLNGGTFVKRLLDNISNLNKKKFKRKIFLYSAHDKNLHAYLKAHNITELEQPSYGSSIILETHSDSNNKLYIKLFYWNGEPRQMKSLKLENCSETCPLETYFEIIKQVLPSEDEMLCLLKNLTPKDLENHFYNTNLSC